MRSTLSSEAVTTLLGRLHAKASTEDKAAKQRVRARESELGGRLSAPQRYALYGNAPLAIAPDVGELFYLLALARRARRIVEFGASHGLSTIYLAAAIRDGGAGSLITTELLPSKAHTAAENLAEAKLEDLVEVRVGDALQTLKDLAEEVDLLVLDGRNDQYLAVLRLVEPCLAPDALIAADLGNDDPDLVRYQVYMRDPAHGYFSIELSPDAGVELSVRLPDN